MWTPLQRWYWVQCLNTKTFPTARGDYRLLAKVDGRGKQRMAVDADVVPGLQQGWPPFPFPFPFALTPQAGQAGAVALKVDTVHYGSAQMNQMLAEWIYDGQSPDDLIRPAWVGALGVFVLGLLMAIPRVPMLEHGRRLRGPQDRRQPLPEGSARVKAVARCQYGHSLPSESVACSQGSVPSFAPKRDLKGIGSAPILRPKSGRAERTFDGDRESPLSSPACSREISIDI